MTVSPSWLVRFTGRWQAEWRPVPGSVPDRPCGAFPITAFYRPETLAVTLSTSAADRNPRALRMENGSGIMRGAVGRVSAGAVEITGAVLRGDGTPGGRRHREIFYDSWADLPDWARDAIAGILSDLTGLTAGPE
jgi:hypothetical protein